MQNQMLRGTYLMLSSTRAVEWAVDVMDDDKKRNDLIFEEVQIYNGTGLLVGVGEFLGFASEGEGMTDDSVQTV
jgi:hypothetical protein